MKKTVFILIFIITSSCSTSRIKKNSSLNFGKFVYTKYNVITNDASIKINKDFKKSLEWIAKDMDSIERKEFVNSESHNVMMVKPKHDSLTFEFEIYPDYFWEPLILTNGNLTGKAKFTDRDSLYQCVKKTKSSNCKNKSKIPFFNEGRYSFEYLKKVKKTILGYKCFKIIAKRKDSSHKYEMYVTKKINFSYNPMINFETINQNYFILELKKTNINTGVYVEYKTQSIDF